MSDDWPPCGQCGGTRIAGGTVALPMQNRENGRLPLSGSPRAEPSTLEA